VFGGVPTTLGVLRANHRKLVARFAQAAAIGNKMAADVRARPVALSVATPAPGSAHQYVVVPPIANLAGGSGVPVPQDARDVCAALAATACLYPAKRISSAFS
jgi:hypothetical protein